METIFFTGLDTVRLIENTQYGLRSNRAEGQLIVEKNAPASYFRNEVSGRWEWSTAAAELTGSLPATTQGLVDARGHLHNTLRTLLPLGNHNLTLFSRTSYQRNAQDFRVRPGRYAEVLGLTTGYEELTQRMAWKQFYQSTYLGYRRNVNKLEIEGRLGLAFQDQQLTSGMVARQSGIPLPLGAPYTNSLGYTYWKPYGEVEAKGTLQGWHYKAQLVLSGHRFQLSDTTYQFQQQVDRITAEPLLSLRKQLGKYWEFRGSARLRNPFGDIDQLYRGYLLTQYRMLQRNIAPLWTAQQQQYRVKFDYSRLERSALGHVSYTYNRQAQNLVEESLIEANGLVTQQVLELPNQQQEHRLETLYSRFLPRLKSNLRVSSATTWREQVISLNERVVPLHTYAMTVSPTVSADFSRKVGGSYSSTVSLSGNQIAGNPWQSVWVHQHTAQLNYFPADQHYLGLAGEWFGTSQAQGTSALPFVDITYRFFWEALRSHIELKGTNLLQVDTYVTAFNGAYTQVIQQVALRPRQVMLTLRFNVNQNSFRRKPNSQESTD